MDRILCDGFQFTYIPEGEVLTMYKSGYYPSSDARKCLFTYRQRGLLPTKVSGSLLCRPVGILSNQVGLINLSYVKVPISKVVFLFRMNVWSVEHFLNISWPFLSSLLGGCNSKATANPHKSDDRNVQEIFKKYSNDQRCIWKRNTSYKIHTLLGGQIPPVSHVLRRACYVCIKRV